MPKLLSRITKLERQCGIRSTWSLDLLAKQTERRARLEGISFEEAGEGFIRALSDRELDRIIAEAQKHFTGSAEPWIATVNVS
jgi:hypothetical protein